MYISVLLMPVLLAIDVEYEYEIHDSNSTSMELSMITVSTRTAAQQLVKNGERKRCPQPTYRSIVGFSCPLGLLGSSRQSSICGDAEDPLILC
jgi:hypothetical protein